MVEHSLSITTESLRGKKEFQSALKCSPVFLDKLNRLNPSWFGLMAHSLASHLLFSGRLAN